MRYKSLILLLLVWSCSSEPKAINRVNETAFAELMNTYKGALIVDLRTEDAYQKGHLKGAVNLPADDALYDKLYQLSTRQVYLMYCEDGKTAHDLTPMFEELRFREVYLLKHGINDTDFPLVQKPNNTNYKEPSI